MASQKKLCVRSDGSFKVMQIADLQEIPAISPDTREVNGSSPFVSTIKNRVVSRKIEATRFYYYFDCEQ